MRWSYGFWGNIFALLAPSLPTSSNSWHFRSSDLLSAFRLRLKLTCLCQLEGRFSRKPQANRCDLISVQLVVNSCRRRYWLKGSNLHESCAIKPTHL